MNCKVCNAVLNDNSSICPVCGFDNIDNFVDTKENGEQIIVDLIETEPVIINSADTEIIENQAVQVLETETKHELVQKELQRSPALPEKPKRKTGYIVAAVLFAVLIIGFAVYYFLFRPINAPQTKMAIEIATFASDFTNINGEEFFKRLEAENFQIDGSINPNLDIPYLGKSNLIVNAVKTDKDIGAAATLATDMLELLRVSTVYTNENLLVTSKIGTNTSGTYIKIPQQKPKDATESSKQKDLAMQTALLFFDCFDANWFYESSGNITDFNGKEMTTFVRYISLGNKEATEFSNRFTKVLDENTAYCELLNEVLGEGTSVKLKESLAALPALLKSAPFSTLSIESHTVNDVPVAVAVKVNIPNLANISLLLQKLNTRETTDYAAAFEGTIASMSKGEANLKLFFDCTDENIKLLGKYLNDTNDETTNADFNADLILTPKDENNYNSEIKIVSGVNGTDYMPITGNLDIKFGNKTFEYADYYSENIAKAKESKDFGDLISNFIDTLRLDELILLLSLGAV